MKGFLVLAAFVLVSQPCSSRSLSDEGSVVSVYTTLPTTAGTSAPLDVYRQIAGNIAERITQPIYRFFGFANSTEEKTTKRPFEHIELDSPEKSTGKNKTDVKNNEIPDRDVEELSVESLQKTEDKKPEKFTLFSSLSSAYLPVKQNLDFNASTVLPDLNDTKVDIDKTVDSNDNSLELDDVDSDFDGGEESGREGPFIYFLELMGSIIQLLWGGFLALFKPSTSSSSS